jgi:NAD(P)-dependent dehydrogenase (short-subunit alcohol dehydrogenase family)
MRLEGKVAIVTGAAQGIGRAIALMFAREGARISVGDVKDDGGKMTVSEVLADGGVGIFQHCDVTHMDDIHALVSATMQTYGRIDILVNNAAIWVGGSVTETAVADWELGRTSILDAAYYTCKAAIPAMVQGGGGSIITISSVHGLVAARHSASYEAAKAGVILLMKQIACDYGRDGIRANCICPGLIVTEKSAPAFEKNPDRSRLNAEIYPLRRYGRPEDIAQAALFLSSDESSFITGHALVVDGGMTAQLQDDLAYRMMQFTRDTGIAPE